MIVHVMISVVTMMEHVNVHWGIQQMIVTHVMLDIMCLLQFPMKIPAQVLRKTV